MFYVEYYSFGEKILSFSTCSCIFFLFSYIFFISFVNYIRFSFEWIFVPQKLFFYFFFWVYSLILCLKYFSRNSLLKPKQFLFSHFPSIFMLDFDGKSFILNLLLTCFVWIFYKIITLDFNMHIWCLCPCHLFLLFWKIENTKSFETDIDMK